MLPYNLPLRVNIEQRVVTGCTPGLSIAFAHPHDDVDASTFT